MKLYGLQYFPVLSLILPLAAARYQSDTPPPPQTTPAPGLVETCLDEGLGKCFSQAFSFGGWWLLISVGALLLSIYLLRPYVQGWLEAWKKVGQKSGEEFFASDDFSKATSLYLEKVIEDFRRFTFRGLGGRAKDIDPPQLDQAYISLRILPETQKDAVQLDRRAGKKEILSDPLVLVEGHSLHLGSDHEPIELSEAFALSPRLAIVGAAGSGKTTLLQWIGLAMARAMRRQNNLLKPDQQGILREIGSPLLPILLPLREYNRHCLEKKINRTASTLIDFISIYFCEHHPTVEIQENFFSKHLAEGAILMFDGMDEVSIDDRPAVRAAIEQLLRDFTGSPSRCLITSRSYSYIGSARISDGFIQAEVQPLSPDQRSALIHNWYRAIYRGDLDRANSAALDLLSRINLADPRVQELARTPLMATIFAIVHEEGGELPRQRADLYEKCVNFLLTEPHHMEDEAGRSLQDWGGVDPTYRLKRLSYIAFHTLALGQAGDAILEDDLVELLWPEFRGSGDEHLARADARSFVRLVADRGGLLEERDGHYGFYTHRTFREYLAGRFLAEEMSSVQQREFLAGHLIDDNWEEPVLLAAGYLAIGGERRPNEFLNLLVELGDNGEARARGLARALLALADLTPQGKREERVYLETRRRLNDLALSALNAAPPVISIRVRERIGRALGQAGDPRLDPLNPPMISVPAGPFKMGTSPEEEKLLQDQEATVWEDEKPAHLVTLSTFEISLFPVTNAEFLVFWENGGYDQEEIWSADGWRWRTGMWESDLSIYSEEFREKIRRWLNERPIERRDRPFWWDDPVWNVANLPVVGVCWFEAEAYCNWLSQRTGRLYALPREVQWEKAARGAERRLWPWGNTWIPERCNNDELGDKFSRTTPVGMFPDGASPYGVLDLAGNVWEWCRDWYSPEEYARRAETAVLDPEGPEPGQARVVRGGSWFDYRNLVRCAYRHGLVPDYFSNGLGFRLALSPG